MWHEVGAVCCLTPPNLPESALFFGNMVSCVIPLTPQKFANDYNVSFSTE